MPKRFQRKRTKGWRKPPDGIICDRTSKWGNPFRAQDFVVVSPALASHQDYAVCGYLNRMPSTTSTKLSAFMNTAKVWDFAKTIILRGEIEIPRPLTIWACQRYGFQQGHRWMLHLCLVELYHRALCFDASHLLGITEDMIRAELRGHDLGCTCPLDMPCHVDVLLRVANE